ncbi:sugar nucleotide-binding protein [Nocardioides insulae]|uniref:sugar nucleotide-binding protein n=1 Tax=Nocardioides insulae TaxID=394734 RepID=UPI0004057BF6|nr:bifunctional dTDP-4-dehydrorhamnose 3,5-epimerase family protein/NAD(P)-dependent oxidoreductase [Nocardioides insulae]
MADLSIETTPIPGLLVVRLPVHGDARGWFKENWQRAKMVSLGLPDFGPVQNNMSFNASRGATRGIHTEPWDKFVSVATGRVFGAWVDMREGDTFGATYSVEIDEGVAVFVPRGVGNSYQALADGTVYSYLVNDHWAPGQTYPALNLADPTIAIPWPIPLESDEVEVSEKDRGNPRLDDVTPMPAKRILVLGGGGQLGRALAAEFPTAHVVTRSELDLTDEEALAAWPWREYAVIINAAAYTAVDAAEGDEGRPRAWAANATGPATLARIATEHGLTLVHYSSEYVFDGAAAEHAEDEPLSPLGVYGQSKAAGDTAVSTTPRHLLLRTSWVVGEGGNFVRTMRGLAEKGVSPTVVTDQVGRLTFAGELARATRHLLATEAAFGTYNVTNAGPAMSWHDVAAEVFALSGRTRADVAETDSASYAAAQAEAGRPMAARPLNSMLPLDKLQATGFEPEDALTALRRHLAD